MTTPTITELYAQIGDMMANWQRFLDQQMNWQAGPSAANDLAPPDNNPEKKGYRVMTDAAGNKRQIMTPAQMEKIVSDAVQQITDLKPAELAPQMADVRRQLNEVSAKMTSTRAELVGFRDAAASSQSAAASSASAADTSKKNAATSEANALASKNAAASSASDAQKWASNPENSAVTPGKFSSMHHAIKAEQSASVSSAKSQAATESAALASAKAADASAASGVAAAKAGEASASANISQTKAEEAASSASVAVEMSKSAKASSDAASASAASAKTSETTATTRANAASQSATTAQKWAANPVDTAVSPGQFSALHHATKADASASAAAASAATATQKADEAGNSATVASDKATLATTKATEAAASAKSALDNKNAAGTSASSASASATTATQKAGEAGQSASAAAKSASDSAASAAASKTQADAAAASAKIAQDAAAVATGGLVEAGEVSMASGDYPPPLKSKSGSNIACFWKVTTAGVSKVGGIDYEVGDTLVYSSSTDSYYKIDNTDAVVSVNNKKGAVVLTAADVGALAATAAAVAAAKLSTGRSISISGHGSGSVTFDGSANVAIPLVVKDDSHKHTFSNLKDLPSTLAGYGIIDAAPLTHTHADLFSSSGGSITGQTLINIANGPTIGGATFGNGWLRIGSANGGIAFDPNEIAAVGNDLSFGTLSNHIVSLVVNKNRIGEMRADGLYSMGSKVLTAAAGVAVSASKLESARTLSLSGDATGSMSFDGSTNTSMAVTLSNSGVAAGTYTKVTVDAKGRVTAASGQTAADIPNLDWAKITSGKPTNLAGYGVSSATLRAIESLAMAADSVPYFTAANAAASMKVTAAARALLDDADVAAMRATLGVPDTSAVSASQDGLMSAADKVKLDSISAGANKYEHPTGDGNLHVPATGTSNAGKVLKAGATAGAIMWASLAAADVGLDNLNNWEASASITDPSDQKYATAGAVKRAADIANAALARSGGNLTGNVTFTNDSVIQWSRNTDFAAIGFKNDADSDTDSFMWFKTGDNGNEYFKWQVVSGSTVTDVMTLKADNLRVKGFQVFHQGFKPTKADLGLELLNNWAATSSITDGSETKYASAAAVKQAATLLKGTRKEFTVGGDPNTYYMVVVAPMTSDFGDMRVMLSRAYNWPAPNTWNTATHKGGLTLSIRWSGDGAWGGNSKNWVVDHFSETYSTMVARVSLLKNGMAFWLRGGGAKYCLQSDYGVDTTFSVIEGDYTDADKAVYSPMTTIDRGELNRRYSLRDGQVFDLDARVYSPSNKPTAYEIGALALDDPYKSAADVATTGNLAATYANGSAGVGATLTATANGALSIDGVACQAGYRVLVKNQTSSAQNGIYAVTNPGSATTPWVLTRVADADTTSRLAGAVVTVDQGTANGSLLFTNDWKKTSTVGTNGMNWRVVVDSGNISSYHHGSGVPAGTYRSVTVNSQGHVTGGSNPTTLAGYGITDAAPSGHVGSGGDAHANATGTADGFMSAADKKKLDGIAAGANSYSHPGGDGNLHVPATGTGNNGKFLMAGATAGSLQWKDIGPADVGALPIGGGTITGALTVNGELRSLSANSMRIVQGNYGTFWRNDGSNLYLMFTNASDQYGSYNGLRPMYANLATGNVNFGHNVDINGQAYINTGSTSWIDMRSSNAIQGRSAVSNAAASAIVRQEHADRHFILGGLGNSQFGIYMINKSRTANGTDAAAYLSADGTWYCNGNASVNDVQIRSDIRLKSDFKEIADPWDFWKLLRISEYTKAGARELGFVAQDFVERFSAVVTESPDDKHLSLRPMGVLALAGKVIQEMQKRIEQLEAANAGTK
ncbi:phage tail fiber protein [Aeromonas sp. Y318-3]|uniref:phage tail fiber protein n=1 Tax=Aeromonas sp. Y318-3 TaxID=2990509 RepID=UPI0022E29E98|nr:tail fiber domain-containing protein [Aeromonas sp. Y318-3]